MSTLASESTELMSRSDFGSLLNTLLEAERAGAKLLAAYLSELPPQSTAWTALHKVQRDEAHNCAVLIHLLLNAEVEPSTAVGDFHERGLALRKWSERLEFLNRGQAWVARRIAEALPRIPELGARTALRAMHESHVQNIDLCERVFG
jgi:hypothetical protein